MIEVLKTHELAIFKQATEGSVGYDLCTTEDIKLSTDCPHALAPTGILLNMTKIPGVYGMVAARSSLYSRTHCVLANGVGIIDNDYLGEIKLSLLFCPAALLSGLITETTIYAGTALAQLVFHNMNLNENRDVIFVDKFSNTTDRGEGSFGSTDRRNADTLGGMLLC